MDHSFNVEIAVKFRNTHLAIIIQNIAFWLQKNMANEHNFHDGRYWTYNSIKAFQRLFPYLTENQIRRTLEYGIKEGVILVGNYNPNTYDRTKWYSLSDEILDHYKIPKPEDTPEKIPKQENCPDYLADLPNGEKQRVNSKKTAKNTAVMHLSNLPNGFEKSAKSYNTDNKPYNKQQTLQEPCQKEPPKQNKEMSVCHNYNSNAFWNGLKESWPFEVVEAVKKTYFKKITTGQIINVDHTFYIEGALKQNYQEYKQKIAVEKQIKKEEDLKRQKEIDEQKQKNQMDNERYDQARKDNEIRKNDKAFQELIKNQSHPDFKSLLMEVPIFIQNRLNKVNAKIAMIDEIELYKIYKKKLSCNNYAVA